MIPQVDHTVLEERKKKQPNTQLIKQEQQNPPKPNGF